MTPPRQHVTFALLLVLVAIILGATVYIAREKQTIRLPADPAPMREFADEWQRQVARLERTYEGHLARLTRFANLEDRDAIWRECEQVAGVQQFSLLHRASERALDLHIPIAFLPLPQPAFRADPAPLAPRQLLLPEDELIKSEENSGWLDAPGEPLVYWRRRAPDECAVLLLDSAAIAREIESWVAPGLKRTFQPLGIDAESCLLSPTGAILAGAQPPGGGTADLILPLRSRFGAWQLARWDHRVTSVSYRPGILVGGLAAALLILGCGGFLLLQHARALRLAGQRVSFVNAVSHELRAPVTNILLNVELASDLLEPTSPAATRLRFVLEEAQRLARLIENVLTFSRAKTAPTPAPLRPCSPAAIIRAALEQFRPGFERRGLTLELHDESATPCLMDPDALLQIVTNLLSNIEKYVPSGGATITLRHAGGTLLVLVHDTGPGIPTPEADAAFEPFRRLDSRLDASASGTGLGLAISRRVAESLGGSLTLEPAATGACFALHLPFRPADAPTLAA